MLAAASKVNGDCKKDNLAGLVKSVDKFMVMTVTVISLMKLLHILVL